MNQKEAISILKTGANVFLTGEPGAGKTHVVNDYVKYLHDHDVEVAITASTGIAATHIGGLTVHSWSGIGIKDRLTSHDIDRIASTEYIAKRIRHSKVLIIDEVSMLSPNILTMVDMVCQEVKQRESPFGGLQVILVGDFFQLPPVVRTNPGEGSQISMLEEEDDLKRFAFCSPVWLKASLITCYLTDQYRQDDQIFLSILSAIRKNKFSSDHLRHLHKRKILPGELPPNVPKLFSHNVNVDNVNDATLERIKDKKEVFTMLSTGHDALVAILKRGCLSPEILSLKLGAEVMFTKNSQQEGYVNGTLGTVIGFEGDRRYPKIKLRDGKVLTVEPAEWIVEENGKVKGRISQIPLRLAWAITVHKSQGMSMDEAIMDLSRVFEYGQGYVALSRVRRLSGLYLLGWNERAFKVHPDILAKDEEFRIGSDEAREAFAKMNQNELEEMHNNFIVASDGSLNAVKKSKINKPKKQDTKLVTWDLWKQNKGVAEIAKIRGVKVQTIFSHIEDLVELGKIDRDEIRGVLSPDVLRDLAKIHAAFRDLDTNRLTPVYEKFNEKYSFDDLRLARMLIIN
ncbi:MAG: helix-turn-helix domain-containing protein [Candidatus Vogelbacteria bacterium]|nr:helix-turn-helix domain-containing protein [Candidatus Vogelbacteria bacterium]